MTDRIENLGQVLDAAKAINRVLPANLPACYAAGEGIHPIPLSLLVELQRTIRAVRDGRTLPNSGPELEESGTVTQESGTTLCIHSGHATWMHHMPGVGHLCEEQPREACGFCVDDNCPCGGGKA